MLENTGKLELDCVREGSVGGTTGTVIDCSGSIATFTTVRTFAGRAADGTAAAPSSSATPASTDGTLRSVVGLALLGLTTPKSTQEPTSMVRRILSPV